MTDVPITTFESYIQRINGGLRECTGAYGFTKVRVGSSGGIDSALTIARAAQTLGPENVTAITMPSVFSSAGIVTDSQAVIDKVRQLVVRSEFKRRQMAPSIRLRGAPGLTTDPQ